MADTGIGFTTILSYNGYAFDSTAHIEVEEEAVPDDARRTILYQQLTFTVDFIVAGVDAATLSSTLDSIRTTLNEPGRPFLFKNAGFGDPLLVNAGAGSLTDVRFGPMPKVRTWGQIGSSRAVECKWTCVVCVPTCNTDGSLRSSGLMALNFRVSTSLKDGYATRTTAGYLQIAMTRIPGTKRIPDCADLYRAMIAPPKPPNFKRESDYTVSDDKARLDFAIVDTEIRSDNPYPMFVVQPTGRHRVGWRRGQYMMRLMGSISMELELDQSHTQDYGWNIFYTIAKQRLQAAADTGRAFLLTSLEVEEDIWGKASSFQLDYTFMTGPNTPDNFVQDMLTISGIWQPVPADWNRWTASMAKVFDPYGNAQLRTRPETDLIIDLCSNDTIPWSGDAPQNTQNPTGQQPTFQNSKPDPKTSYIEYQNVVVPRVERTIQRQSTMQTSDEESSNNTPYSTDGFSSRSYGGTDDIIQQSGRGQYSIEIVGSAVRAGYEIPRPILRQAGTQQPIETFFVMPQVVVGNWFGVPIYQATWRVIYSLVNAPGKFPVQTNPSEGFSNDP